MLQGRGRHPSASLACRTCGFAPPARVVDAAQRLPTSWSAAVSDEGGSQLRSAALLRDEIHGVTNRVMRLVAQPGARLLPVAVSSASAARCEGDLASGPVLHVMQLAVDRLVETMRGLRSDDWDIQGTVVDSGRLITVHDLLLVPLHHSHRDLVLLTADRTADRFC